MEYSRFQQHEFFFDGKVKVRGYLCPPESFRHWGCEGFCGGHMSNEHPEIFNRSCFVKSTGLGDV